MTSLVFPSRNGHPEAKPYSFYNCFQNGLIGHYFNIFLHTYKSIGFANLILLFYRYQSAIDLLLNF